MDRSEGQVGGATTFFGVVRSHSRVCEHSVSREDLPSKTAAVSSRVDGDPPKVLPATNASCSRRSQETGVGSEPTSREDGDRLVDPDGLAWEGNDSAQINQQPIMGMNRPCPSIVVHEEPKVPRHGALQPSQRVR